MLQDEPTHNERFQELLGQLIDEVESLKARLHQLQQEKDQLKKELQQAEDEKSDVFSSFKETDRMALKHQIKGLVSKIDEHLEERA